MKILSLIGILSLVLSQAFAQETGPFPKGIEHVIVVGCDGMSPDGIRTASTPNMHQLIETGSVKWNVRTVLPSISAPNWASMIMGAGIEAHGTTDNDWGRADYTLPPIVMGEENIFPTIFGWIRRNRPNAEIGAVYQWSGFGKLFEKSALNYDKNMPDEVSTAETFVQYILNKKPVLGFMHLDHVDDAGHDLGHGTPGYYKAVSKADSLIGLVKKAIEKAGIEESTLLIITADHGGIGYGHGGATLEEAEIAMIFHGKEVKKGYKIQQQVYTYDLAATIAFALKIIPPYAWTGRPVKPAFIGFSEPSNLYLGKTIIPSPKIYPWKYLFQKAGGLYIDSPAHVRIETMAEGAITRYTLDGSIPDQNSIPYTHPFLLNSTQIVTARSFDKNGNASLPIPAYFRFSTSAQGPGVQLRYFPGKDWNHLPPFSTLRSTHEWKSYEFNLKREMIQPWLEKDNDVFGVLGESQIQIDTPGKYKFYTQSDDGSKLFVDDQMVVDNDGGHGVIEKTGEIELKPGKHNLRLEFFNGGGGFWLDVLYSGPGIPKQIIPANKLTLK